MPAERLLSWPCTRASNPGTRAQEFHWSHERKNFFGVRRISFQKRTERGCLKSWLRAREYVSARILTADVFSNVSLVSS